MILFSNNNYHFFNFVAGKVEFNPLYEILSLDKVENRPLDGDPHGMFSAIGFALNYVVNDTTRAAFKIDASVEDGKEILVSHGNVTAGGNIHIHPDYVCIEYTRTAGFHVFQSGKTDVTFPARIQPLEHYSNPFSRITNQLPTSFFAYEEGTLWNYDGVSKILPYECDYCALEGFQPVLSFGTKGSRIPWIPLNSDVDLAKTRAIGRALGRPQMSSIDLSPVQGVAYYRTPKNEIHKVLTQMRRLEPLQYGPELFVEAVKPQYGSASNKNVSVVSAYDIPPDHEMISRLDGVIIPYDQLSLLLESSTYERLADLLLIDNTLAILDDPLNAILQKYTRIYYEELQKQLKVNYKGCYDYITSSFFPRLKRQAQSYANDRVGEELRVIDNSYQPVPLPDVKTLPEIFGEALSGTADLIAEKLVKKTASQDDFSRFVDAFSSIEPLILDTLSKDPSMIPGLDMSDTTTFSSTLDGLLVDNYKLWLLSTACNKQALARINQVIGVVTDGEGTSMVMTFEKESSFRQTLLNLRRSIGEKFFDNPSIRQPEIPFVTCQFTYPQMNTSPKSGDFGNLVSAFSQDSVLTTINRDTVKENTFFSNLFNIGKHWTKAANDAVDAAITPLHDQLTVLKQTLGSNYGDLSAYSEAKNEIKGFLGLTTYHPSRYKGVDCSGGSSLESIDIKKRDDGSIKIVSTISVKFFSSVHCHTGVNPTVAEIKKIIGNLWSGYQVDHVGWTIPSKSCQGGIAVCGIINMLIPFAALAQTYVYWSTKKWSFKVTVVIPPVKCQIALAPNDRSQKMATDYNSVLETLAAIAAYKAVEPDLELLKDYVKSPALLIGRVGDQANSGAITSVSDIRKVSYVSDHYIQGLVDLLENFCSAHPSGDDPLAEFLQPLIAQLKTLVSPGSNPIFYLTKNAAHNVQVVTSVDVVPYVIFMSQLNI